MTQATCFFITPIGGVDSPERAQADELMKYVLLPCCTSFGLELVRADKIAGDNDINQDVIHHVQTAEICVVDLTGLNPNVMFEFGMRQQTELPVIILAKEGTKLPFDVVSRRTIFFEDLSQTTVCHDLTMAIRQHIEQFKTEGYRKRSTEPTNLDIYTLLTTIERKLFVTTRYESTQNTESIYATELDNLLQNLSPSEAFSLAYRTNQIKQAEQLLELLKAQPFEYYFNKICALATKGSFKAMNELEQMLPNILESNDFNTTLEAIGSLVSCYMRNAFANDKTEYIMPIFESALGKTKSNKERAAILNQKQRLFAGAARYDDAMAISAQLIHLNDEEPAYFFNYASILRKIGDVEKARQQIKKCVILSGEGEEDDDHLMLACKLLKGASDVDDQNLYAKCLKRLKEINPYKARLLAFDVV